MPPSAMTVDSINYGGEAMVGGLLEENRHSRCSTKITYEQDMVLKTFRLLVADLCQQFGGGHPGGAIGMAAIGVALWKYSMRYAPHTPTYFNRDRFVLSNGHCCLWQYCFLHLTGYKDMTFDQLKSYHSDRPDALCPGHPEIENEGIEVTTGPLGQGIANAVGLAMASQHLAAVYNKPNFEVVNNHTWCMIGDACLQEGVALEAISLAGHLKLDNLTVLYDNNQVTCDGSVDLTNTEDVNAKMKACGWEVIDVEDGCFDIPALIEALHKSRTIKIGKPVFINIRTIIGVGSAVAGEAAAHGAAFGKSNVAAMKEAYGFDPNKYFVIGDETKQFFKDIPAKGEKLVANWNSLLSAYGEEHPDSAAELTLRIKGELPSTWKDHIPASFPTSATPSRKSAGLVFNPIAEAVNSFMVGTADLSPSVNMIWPGKVDFQHPDLKTTCGINGNYTGRYIHYGIREHSMAAIANGMAAFAPQTIIPVTSTFFMFYLYAAPAVRMGALQKLQVIHVATHDSIGTGEDGPTHQPIELAALYRAMPDILYIRPGDSEEVAGAWITAIEAKHSPSIISLSRHALPQQTSTSRDKVSLGAYVLIERAYADLTLIGIGSELNIAVSLAEQLTAEHGLRVRVVSFPCSRLFEKQSREYQRGVLRRHECIPAIVVEAYASNGWERWSDASFSMKQFGHSLPGSAAYKHFGFTPEQMVPKVVKYLSDINEDVSMRREFVEL
ncbi:hypothetical protein V491_00789 [Pseudogymnoascus sp. VKM F-3775]|nr:hypothetical protein V491_00789 [Pseudogymnoascus sp. VKM F-3775]